MTEYDVIELICRDGVGDDLECSCSSRNIKKEKYLSKISNYKFDKKDGTIKFYVDQYHLQKHKENLSNSVYFEFLIKKSEKNRTIILYLDCKVFKIEKNVIHAKVLNVRYLDDKNEKANYRIAKN